jgi:exopolyphosphatase/guanosine-5'-triphosphate,3'-diphosphate pyrophosphatase
MKIAALDLGSNSFHLIVADAQADGSFRPLVTEKEMLLLGDDVVRHGGRISDELIERSVATVRRFRMLAESVGATELHAVATSALRSAENGDEVLTRFEDEVGISVDLISGAREAALIFGAIRHAVVLDPAPALCADLGGGSLELIVGDTHGPVWLSSLPLGVSRLSAHYITEDPVSKRDRRRLHDAVRKQLDPALAEAMEHAPGMLVGSSGTFTDIARMVAVRRTGSVPNAMNQFRFTKEEFGELASELFTLDRAARRKVDGLDSRRADLIHAGLVVCGALFDATGLHEMTISEWALREGVLLRAIQSHDAVDWSDDPRAIRRASVLTLAERCSWNAAHAQHVAKLAVSLFDQCASLHGLRLSNRYLLEYAALLHDIGEHVAVDGHHRHGAYLVMHGALRGFTPEEIQIMAAIVRWHRKGEPKDTDEIYGSLSVESLQRVRTCVAFLRVADGLDRSYQQAVASVAVHVSASAVDIVLHRASGADIELELWGARRKRDLLGRVFARDVHVRDEAAIAVVPPS